MTHEPPVPDGRDEGDVAGEYVLGVLDGEARARAAERMRGDPLFRAEVRAWELRLAPMLDAVAEVAPPAGSWRRVAASLAAPSSVVEFRSRPSVWNRVEVWRATAGGLAAAAAGLAVAIAIGPALRAPPRVSVAPPPQGRVLTAKLSTPGGQVLFVAIVDRARHGVTVVPVGTVDARGRSPELWIIAAGSPPRPVGLLKDGQPLSVSSAVLSSASPQALLAVSMEPAGGSTTGAPMGPVIATGSLTAS